MASSTKSCLVIAAIDFGTTYSGYAYAFLKDLKETDKVVAIRAKNWMNDLAQAQSQKTSTCILFDKAGKFHSFGLEAEKKYTDLAGDDEHVGWRFFKHFKMMLHGQKIQRQTKIKDDQGQSMNALGVFSAAIKYLKDDLMNTLKNRVTSILDSDVKWVITVPAIWNYKAKQFMKEAALEAGIDARHFCLAHEPEAAAIYCKHIQMCKANDSQGRTTLQSFQTGSQFMILDLGGGTIDIAACKVQGDGSLLELCPRGGGPWGGTVVDEHLFKCFENVIGKEVMRSFFEDCKYDHLQLTQSIEIKKRMCGMKQESDTTKDTIHEDIKIDMPAELLTIYKDKHMEKLETTLANIPGMPRMKRNKICFSHDKFAKAFEEPIEQIIKEVRSLISKYNLKLNTFLMVGGFSESPIIQQAVRAAFPRKAIIIPEEASASIMKGAVLYGYRSSYISSRRLPYSFGISTTEKYDTEKHRKGRVNWSREVEDVFCPYVLKGKTVTEKGIVVQKVFGLTSKQVEVYQTPRDDFEDTAYTYEDDFECIGVVKFDSPVEAKTVDVNMTFGIFDIKVSVRPTGSVKWHEQSFDAL